MWPERMLRLNVAAAMDNQKVIANSDRVIHVRRQRTVLHRFAIHDQREVGIVFDQAETVSFDLVERAMPFGDSLSIESEVRAFS